MLKYRFHAALIASFVVSISAAPCQDFTCDSLSVRAILDSNGMDYVPVSKGSPNGIIQEIQNNRIVQLTFSPANIPEKLSKMPAALGDISMLRQLRLIGQTFSSFPYQIANLNYLQLIVIQDHSTLILDNNIGKLSSLNNLSLTSCDITYLPDSIGQLDSLRTIYVRDCKLSQLPATIGDCKNLHNIELRNNLLTSLPSSIGNLDSLRTLELSENQISDLPETIGNLSSLQELQIARNKLSVLPNSICMLRLHKLNLSNNALRALPDSIISINPTDVNVDYNNLCNLSSTIKSWLVTKGAWHPETQDCQIAYFNNHNKYFPTTPYQKMNSFNIFDLRGRCIRKTALLVYPQCFDKLSQGFYIVKANKTSYKLTVGNNGF
jgi:hypothetical protein